jgi:hypothetical protein
MATNRLDPSHAPAAADPPAAAGVALVMLYLLLRQQYAGYLFLVTFFPCIFNRFQDRSLIEGPG